MDQTSNLDYGDKQSMADSSHLIDPMQQVSIDEPADFLKTGGQSKVSTTTHPSSLASMPNVSFASIELPLNEKQPLDLDSPGTPISVNVSDEIQVKQATTAWGRFRSRLQFSNMGLGCFAFWMCGIVFGLVAILLEFKSRYLQQSGSANNHKTAQQLRKASRIVSVVGITIGTVVAITVTCIKVIPILVHIQRSAYWARCLPGSYEFDPEQTSGTRCFAHTSRAFSCNTCMSIGGIYYYDQCYYNHFVCSGYHVDSQCFDSSRSAENGQCRPGEHFSNGQCYFYYSDAPRSCKGYIQSCRCYTNRSTTFTEATCKNIKGFYVRDKPSQYGTLGVGRSVTPDSDAACYFNKYNCQGYSVNGQCFSQVTTKYTALTCKNIGGYFNVSTGQCHSNGMEACPDSMLVSNECYKSFRKAMTCTSCVNSGGRDVEFDIFGYNSDIYDGWMDPYTILNANYRYRCYFTETVDLSGRCNYMHVIPGYSGFTCETNRSSDMNADQCLDVDGTFDPVLGYCYYTYRLTSSSCAPGLHYYRCSCYKFRSSRLNIAECGGISGVYDFKRSLCFHNSTTEISDHCKYGKWLFNGRCFRRRQQAVNSAKDCSGYRAVYDATNLICYLW